MITVADAVTRATASGTPILWLDTSTLLDLVRDPTRDVSGTQGNIRSALEMLGWIEAIPPELTVALANQTNIELRDNRSSVEDDNTQSLQKLDATISRVLAIMSLHGVTHLSHPKLASVDFARCAGDALDRFVSPALIVKDDSDIRDRANDRVIQGIAPSATAKQSYKDCLVVETCMAVTRGLRSRGVLLPVVFLTSNVNDFGDPARRDRLHHQLEPDFTSLQLTFASSFQTAKYSNEFREWFRY